jgi:hypothetical protein
MCPFCISAVAVVAAKAVASTGVGAVLAKALLNLRGGNGSSQGAGPQVQQSETPVLGSY